MDIAKFNKELSYKVAKATGFENNNKIQEAIEEWVEISEIVIRASKTPNLEFSYRSMLIERTKQIIEHIKDLKLKLEGEIVTITPEEISEIQDEIEIPVQDSAIVNSSKNDIAKTSDTTEEKVKVIDDSEFKSLPKGFKEIEATKDFEIITPHDKQYVKKILSKDKTDRSISKNRKGGNKTENSSSTISKINFEKQKDQNRGNCFACGEKVKPDSKICPHCGTVLKK